MHRLRLLDAINAFANGALKMCAVAHSLADATENPYGNKIKDKD